ncbi:enoyl-CoA hydratase/isomerase family protein [Besnoitia besnoiti]|uniref:Enoyl-CoA hydratase/isomerase family protein n=1 Tax=Besnoitia besnoiti TaxID=94643 RepID=A0A2A9M2X2_BESBE|nr:enoyl-CoA hydratase/isomerase family protein [Besnoitia besnoiti]PFH32289.1 enoyl-CoA hydratase/isomerase family protein [Besnoitia besnoiti]
MGQDEHTGRPATTFKYLIIENPVNAPGVTVIKLNRPDSLNALCRGLCDELVDLLKRLDTDDNVRCVVLTGAGGKAFAAGADIKELAELDGTEADAPHLLDKWSQISLFRKPIVCAVNGYALGGGCELAMMCDIVIASTQAIFGQPEVQIGTIPGMGGSQRLPRAVGKSLAMEMILTGGAIDAERAVQAGLASRVVAPAALEHEAIKIASSISKLSLPIVIQAKRCVRRAYELPLEDGLFFERRTFQQAFAYEDRKEGMDAFVQKRAPQWQDK